MSMAVMPQFSRVAVTSTSSLPRARRQQLRALPFLQRVIFREHQVELLYLPTAAISKTYDMFQWPLKNTSRLSAMLSRISNALRTRQESCPAPLFITHNLLDYCNLVAEVTKDTWSWETELEMGVGPTA